jgi:hypothetical protein
MNLQLTFGGKPCLYEWCIISYVICNLTTAILHNDTWDPSCLHRQNQHLVPPPIVLDNSIPLEIGRELIVDIPINPRKTNNIYIDDLISLMMEIKGTDNLVRCDHAPLLAIDTCARPLHQHKPIPWEVMEAHNKLALEAPLKERKTILGLLIDFRQLLIILPENKCKAWTTEIETLLSEGSTTAKELETNICRLVHLGMAIPFVHHFMSCLCDLHITAKWWRLVKTNGEYAKDLKLMREFLKTTYKGISLDSIAFCHLTHVYCSDSCPAGLGGHSEEGFAWRWYIPKPLKFRASNNLLEHLPAIISLQINIIEECLKPLDCVLLMTDSMTAEGWLQKSNFSKLEESKLQSSAQIKAAKNKPIFSCCWDSNYTVNGSKENVMKLQTLSQGTTIEVTKT